MKYEFTIPHFFEEMVNDDLIFAGIERIIATGRIRRRFTRDPRGARYEVVGTTTRATRPQSFAASKKLVKCSS